MTQKTREEHARDAAQALRPLIDQAEAMPGVMDVLTLMDRFDASNEGAATYASVVENVVYYSATNTTRS
jgi:hypothetical protein